MLPIDYYKEVDSLMSNNISCSAINNEITLMGEQIICNLGIQTIEDLKYALLDNDYDNNHNHNPNNFIHPTDKSVLNDIVSSQAIHVTNKNKKIKIRIVKPFVALPAQIKPFQDCYNQNVLLDGTAGWGKSHLALNKVHAFALRYSGATCVFLRKNRAIMKNSSLLFFVREVVGDDPTVIHKPSDFRLEYNRNKSIVCYAGMNTKEQSQHLRSIGSKGGIDLAFAEEATQFRDRDIMEIQARIRGNAGYFRQFILATNPGSKEEYIYKFFYEKRPPKSIVYWGHYKQNIYNGDGYDERLSYLSGQLERNLRKGEWTQGESLCLYDFTHKNISKFAEYDPNNPNVYWFCDEGYAGKIDDNGYYTKDSSPRVILIAQKNRLGQILIIDEIYQCNATPDQTIEKALNLRAYNGMRYPKPVLAITDSTAKVFQAFLERNGIKYKGGTCDIQPRLDLINSYLRMDKNGFIRLLFNPRLKQTLHEINNYNKDEKGKPVDYYNHGIDSLGYGINYLCSR